jgi:Family of unknown function (DUF5522)
MRLEEGIDYTIDKRSGLIVLTAFFLENRGYCCGNKCKNCPYEPKWIKGNKKLDKRAKPST